MKCQTKGCNKDAAQNKVFCYRHLHGQPKDKPIRVSESKYGKKSKNEKTQ